MDLAIFAITASGFEWPDHVSGYDAVSYYVTPDLEGEAYRLFSADAYDVFLLDKQGRIVTSWPRYYDDALTSAIKLKIRQLHGE